MVGAEVGCRVFTSPSASEVAEVAPFSSAAGTAGRGSVVLSGGSRRVGLGSALTASPTASSTDSSTSGALQLLSAATGGADCGRLGSQEGRLSKALAC